MDEKGKHNSYQIDQEILDARGINMTVGEVAGLPTVKYTERVHSLHLGEDDLAFLKGLRRRIKNRLASQNSRRRSMEHLRQLSRELRAVRACKGDAMHERDGLLERRRRLGDRCRRLREYILLNLKDKSDVTDVPLLDATADSSFTDTESHNFEGDTGSERSSPRSIAEPDIFECSLQRLVQKSVNFIYKGVHEPDDKASRGYSVTRHGSHVRSMTLDNLDAGLRGILSTDSVEVLNLSLKGSECGRRKGHGRKQTAPRKIAHVHDIGDDIVLDLKMKKGAQ